MQKTTNYNLNKPEAGDPVRVEDFNENADKIDAALNSIRNEAVTLSGQVRAEAANNLAAYKTTNDAAIAALNTAVAAGLKLETGSYTGSGVCGSASPNTLTFSFPPKIVGIVVDGTGQMRSGIILVKDQTKSSGIGVTTTSSSAFSLILTWSGNSVSWYTEKTSSADNQLNASGYTYHYFAIG